MRSTLKRLRHTRNPDGRTPSGYISRLDSKPRVARLRRTTLGYGTQLHRSKGKHKPLELGTAVTSFRISQRLFPQLAIFQQHLPQQWQRGRAMTEHFVVEALQ